MIRLTSALLLSLLAIGVPPAAAQSTTAAQGASAAENSATGTVVSSTRTTLVIRTDPGEYKLYELNSDTTRPAALPPGATVNVASMPLVDGASVPVASMVRVTAQPVQGLQPKPATPDEPVPQSVRNLESSIQRQTGRYRVGVRAGAALDPELIVLGAQAQIGPFFNENVWARPNLEFGFGEVTDLIGLNFDGIYRVPVTNRNSRWNFFFGGGPVLNFVKLGFERTDIATPNESVEFDDFDLDFGLNILAGVQSRGGMFMELKTTVYADPGMRFVIGTNLWGGGGN
jgi:hypothetical protein